MDAVRTPVFPIHSYGASKAALHELTRHPARELGPQHITVNSIAPGPFPSKQLRAATLEEFGLDFAAALPLGRIGVEDDTIFVAVYLASWAASYVTGTMIPVDGGITTMATGM